uniref:NADH dehydrogenase subunit 5 n=1 Tax=Anaplectoidea varia TaxID=1928789 RepID=UPI00279B5878|nr:NADH dehydrogenase subunit 5 [Anaplectoidea varia]WGO57061.1 NADH dehydrogenase subunit 5 [Anaplectoidea varia]
MKCMSICNFSSFFLMVLSLVMLVFGFFLVFSDLLFFFEWFIVTLNSSSIVMTILVDWMSCMFMGFVLLISCLVIKYSGGYMSGDLNMNRFIFLVLLFVMSMVLLIISPNMISILLGWDGLGLISYCLVIYYQNIKSFNAGMLTALSNRVGDVALLMVIAWMLNFGSWSYIFYLDFMSDSFEMTVIGFLVILAGMTSSAQIPFSSWLPAAMAAPTPVSALVHSSTLVTAGVYLLIRFNVVFDEFMSSFLLFISVLTMFMAGLGANFEYDLKKIIALSTLSQLGLMMGILSLGFAGLAFFHLLMHALFKALLFMCAGVMIHNLSDSQDIRFMGSISFLMPLTSSCLMVSNFALCGMPFLAGFYSKDLILEVVMMGYMNFFMFILFFFSTGLTVCYSFRLFFYSLCGDFNMNSFYVMWEIDMYMVSGMLGLVFLVVFMGSLMSWIIFPVPVLIMLPLFLKMVVLVISFLGGWLGYEVFKVGLGLVLIPLKFFGFSCFVGSMWFMPYIFTYGFSFFPLLMGYKYYSMYDGGWSEYFGGQGLFYVLLSLSEINQWWQFNSLSLFLMLFFFWLILVMFLII